MDSHFLQEIFEAQGRLRWTIAQTSAKERIAKLKKLRKALVARQREFYDAVWQDFHKSEFEAWECEIFPAIEEIDYTIKNLKKWMKDKPAKRVFFLPATKSFLHYEPKGRVLILAPWNYPFLLFINPIVSAIAAGNVIMAKPSQKTPNVSAFLASLIKDIFDDDEITVIEGSGATVGDELLTLPFDHIFFTGSPSVGKHVAEMAARNYTSTTLELGGKSPMLALPDINVQDAAKKIAWGKMLNAGQTCIAPDYLLCARNVVQELARAVAQEIRKMFGESDTERRNSPDFTHIVDSRAVKRHSELIKDALDKGATSVIGGECDLENHYTPATVLANVTPEMDIMQSEIFGPILPIIAYDSLDEAISFIQKRPKPLALYIYGKSSRTIKYVLAKTTSGSTCVNNCIVQIENLSMPFGGVGMSGTGNYHGFYGFRAFSHERNIMFQKKPDIVSLFHPPYRKRKKAGRQFHCTMQKIAEKILRLIKKT